MTSVHMIIIYCLLFLGFELYKIVLNGHMCSRENMVNCDSIFKSCYCR